MNTHDRHRIAMGQTGFHPRLTVLRAAPHERTSLGEHIARTLRAAGEPPLGLTGEDPNRSVLLLGPDDLDTVAQEIADRRIGDHVGRRDDLEAELREAEEVRDAAAARRDEAAARAQRLAGHLRDCEELLEDSAGLSTAIDEAERELDARQEELAAARDRLAVVMDKRETAERAIDDARSQLEELEASEADESTIRRRLEEAGQELRGAEEARDAAMHAYQELEARAYERNATREQIAQERTELAARIEAPLYDPQPLQEALDAFDAEASAEEVDPVAQGLAAEWLEVSDELARIEAALPEPPSQTDISSAEQQLGEIETIVAELEATSRHSRLDARARADIEAAHEAVLAAEEALDQAGGHPALEQQLEEARVGEQQVLAHYGYETYLDLVMAEPEPTETQSELMDALRARRHAEDTLASLWAATEPPPIVATLQSRRERIYREASELLCCEPGERIVELLQDHPVVPSRCTRDIADLLAAYGVYPSEISVRDAALDLLLGIEREVAARDGLLQEVERLDAELIALDDEDSNEAGEGQELMESAQAAAADVEAIAAEITELERELLDRAGDNQRRLQRAEAAEQLRAQIAAVSEALERSDDEYHANVADAEAAVQQAEVDLERATAALSDAARRLRSISEALPPTLRPKATDDPLADLPRLHEMLAGEAERAEAAVTSAGREHERACQRIERTATVLDDHEAQMPADEVLVEDFHRAVEEMVGQGPEPVMLDDPFALLDQQERGDLLEVLARAASRRPVVLLTDDPDTLSWAISLPEEVGAVTGLPVTGTGPTRIDLDPERPATDATGAVAPSSP